MSVGLLWAVTACTCAGAPVTSGLVKVRVVSADECVVNTQRMRCETVGTYLRHSLQVTVDRSVRLLMDGTPYSPADARRVRDVLRAAWYSQVITVGFVSEPGGGGANAKDP